MTCQKQEAQIVDQLCVVEPFAGFVFALDQRREECRATRCARFTDHLTELLVDPRAVSAGLERALDKLHPVKDPLIGQAKDCAAAAVLVMALASLGVLAALLYEVVKN